jgi:hypothetical protein
MAELAPAGGRRLAKATVEKSALTCADGGSPRSDSNRRPSDYESKSLRPAGAVQVGSGCSRQWGRPASAFLTCRVTAGGMTKRMTACPREDYRSWGLPSDSDRKATAHRVPWSGSGSPGLSARCGVAAVVHTPLRRYVRRPLSRRPATKLLRLGESEGRLHLPCKALVGALL